MPSPKIIAAIVLAAAIATGQVPGVPALVGGASDDAADAVPPAPEVVPVFVGEPTGPDDGYTRLILTPTGSADATSAGTAPSEPTPEPADQADGDLASESADASPLDTEIPQAGTPQPETDDADGDDALRATADEADTEGAAAETEPLRGEAIDATEADDTAAQLGERAVDDRSAVREVDVDEIDAETLEQLTAGAELVIDEDGRPWAEYPNGIRVPLWRGGAAEVPAELLPEQAEPTPAAPDVDAAEPTQQGEMTDVPEELAMVADPPLSVGHPLMDLVATLDEVAEVVPIGDGTFAVTLVNPAVLDGLPLEITDDVPLTIAGDDLEIYQWALDNTGDNLATVLAETPPEQLPDADLDVAKALSGATGAGVIVALVDTGVDFSHPDLAHAQWTNPLEECGNDLDDDNNGYVDDCVGWDFVGNDNVPFDAEAHPHGTHLAGVIAAAHNGVGVSGIAPKALVMDLNVASTTATGEPGITMSAVARAVRYAVDNGAHIVNLSLATAPGTPRGDVAALERAIRYAEHHGVLVVAAAGNQGADLTTSPVWPAALQASNLITVGASDPTDGPAQFSNHGPSVHVFAPGELIVSTAPEAAGSHLFMSGTSQAASAVAATAALVLDRTPELPPDELRQQLIDTADRNDALAGSVANGVRLNAGNAVGKGSPVYLIGDVRAAVTGLDTMRADTDATVSFDIAVPAEHFVEPYRWEASLFAAIDDAAFAVVDHPVDVAGLLERTDERGAIGLGVDGSGQVDWLLRLPEGRYQLVLEAVPLDDPGARFGDPLVTSFTVTDGAGPAPAVLAMVDDPEADAESDEAAAEPDPAPADPVSADGWSIESVAPHHAATDTQPRVQLLGSFPEATHVWFGDTPGSVLSQSEGEIVVAVPPRSEPGAVDISLRRPGTDEPLVMAGGFIWTPGRESGDETAAAAPGPALVAPASEPSAADDADSEPRDLAAEPQNQRQTRAQLGKRFDLPTGVPGSRILGNDPRADGPTCDAGPCLLG